MDDTKIKWRGRGTTQKCRVGKPVYNDSKAQQDGKANSKTAINISKFGKTTTKIPRLRSTATKTSNLSKTAIKDFEVQQDGDKDSDIQQDGNESGETS